MDGGARGQARRDWLGGWLTGQVVMPGRSPPPAGKTGKAPNTCKASWFVWNYLGKAGISRPAIGSCNEQKSGEVATEQEVWFTVSVPIGTKILAEN